MKLDSWEEYVKDNNLEADLSLESAVFIVSGLKLKCPDAYEYIMDEVNGAIDSDEVGKEVIDGNVYEIVRAIEVNARISLSSYIQSALDNIEDIEQDCSQCDIEAHKRHMEANQ